MEGKYKQNFQKKKKKAWKAFKGTQLRGLSLVKFKGTLKFQLHCCSGRLGFLWAKDHTES